MPCGSPKGRISGSTFGCLLAEPTDLGSLISYLGHEVAEQLFGLMGLSNGGSQWIGVQLTQVLLTGVLLVITLIHGQAREDLAGPSGFPFHADGLVTLQQSVQRQDHQCAHLGFGCGGGVWWDRNSGWEGHTDDAAQMGYWAAGLLNSPGVLVYMNT